MKKIKWMMALTSTLLALGASIPIEVAATSQDKLIEQVVKGERRDGEVVFEDDFSFLNISAEEKQKRFAEYDMIETFSKSTKSPISYSNIEEITSQEAYTEFILSTMKEAKIIYLGFNECPACKAFSPKINQFAKEQGIQIAYYNTRSRAGDRDYDSVINSYQVDTVPHAFIMSKGKPIAKVNHASSMEALEAFVNKMVELNK